ncbi:TonB dependent receptor [compost metagenome]
MGLGNDELKWQQTEKYNIGVDAEFINRRLRLTADYYVETTKDLVSSVNLPASSGFTSYVDNIGRLRNNGYELKATGFILNNPKSVIWSVSAALLHNKNKIVETSKALKDAQAATLNGNSDPGTLYIEGYSSNAIWVVPSLGIDPSTGKELYLGKDGQPTYTWKATDIVAVGSRDPKFFGNFSTMIRYKDFAINTSFRYTVGGQQYNRTLVDRVELTNYKNNVDSRVFYSRWQNPGDVAAFKGLLVTTPTYKSSRFVQDENTLVLQNINFQYNLTNREWLKKMKLESLNLTVNASEPMYLSTIRRERGTSYPFSRQFSMSLSATF